MAGTPARGRSQPNDRSSPRPNSRRLTTHRPEIPLPSAEIRITAADSLMESPTLRPRQWAILASQAVTPGRSATPQPAPDEGQGKQYDQERQAESNHSDLLGSAIGKRIKEI